uniref:Suppressor of cytokine signaling 5 n=1 Tax=Timema shepardi TaxID=629360 RepID=A0A7R9G355_TIMSH|nr:unnamed protein product [Timema shepardi]
MGQRFSELRGLFGIMASRDVSVSATSSGNNSSQLDNEESREGLCGGSLQQCTVISNFPRGDNGNEAEGMNQHFESIYSSCAEGLRREETNGNLSTETTSVSYCTCPTKSDCSSKCEVDQNANSSLKKSDEQGPSGLRRGKRTLSFVSGKRSRAKSLRSPKDLSSSASKKKRNHWVLKFNCARLKGGNSCGGGGAGIDIPEPNVGCNTCVCTGYRRTEDHHLGAGVVFEARSGASGRRESCPSSESSSSSNSSAEDNRGAAVAPADNLVDLAKFNPDDFPIEDCDERARLERAREIAEGVEPPPGFCPGQHIQLVCPSELTIDNLTAFFQTQLSIHSAALSALSQLDMRLSSAMQRVVHTQVDYIHCLVPDLLQITSCSFYWGKMDRYEAERLLEGRQEGTFLLRDSAQEEYLFSVSFRKYGRSLHARIEQWNHHFSFDSHDPGVFASPTVCGLIEHYKDPSCCMFFEPMLTRPLHRNFPFPLQHLCRAVVSSKVTYDGVNQLHLPKVLKAYLKEYHYKQRVRVRRFDLEH